MKKFALALLATSSMSVLAFQPASAADLPPPVRTPVVKAPVVVPPPVYSWSGFYIGVHGGGAWARKDWGDTTSGCLSDSSVVDYEFITCANDQGSHTAKGALGGVQAGFNLQTGSFVFGIEGQFSYSSLKGSHSSTAIGNVVGDPNVDGLSILSGFTTRVRDLGTIAGRLGVVVGASGAVLLFVKGGAAFADDKFSATTTGECFSGPCPQPDFAATWTGKQFRWGWMVGGGVEAKLTQNVSVKGEYNFLDLGRRDVTLTGEICTLTCSSSSRTFSIDQNIHLVKVGINYSFGGPGR